MLHPAFLSEAAAHPRATGHNANFPHVGNFLRKSARKPCTTQGFLLLNRPHPPQKKNDTETHSVSFFWKTQTVNPSSHLAGGDIAASAFGWTSNCSINASVAGNVVRYDAGKLRMQLSWKAWMSSSISCRQNPITVT
ncbi:hypothetical protein AW736_04390 [Termitidicoccus mucosus]|uniref:Uncharacterized protein n=1 Tax=Termitidicoccus mucosus TaxID=1184151 RepID=A0A178IPM8_9BACT|nr:hypothetical protein AW736_04390 [Opitutaceae bacterium TSB47]